MNKRKRLRIIQLIIVAKILAILTIHKLFSVNIISKQ